MNVTDSLIANCRAGGLPNEEELSSIEKEAHRLMIAYAKELEALLAMQQARQNRYFDLLSKNNALESSQNKDYEALKAGNLAKQAILKKQADEIAALVEKRKRLNKEIVDVEAAIDRQVPRTRTEAIRYLVQFI